MIMEIGSEIANVIVSDHMPVGIPEQVVLNHDGSFSIFLNGKLTYEKQRNSLEHAIRHIKGGDFEKEDVQQIEMEAHGLTERVKCPDEIPPEWIDSFLAKLIIWKFQESITDRYSPIPEEYNEEKAFLRAESAWLYND